MNVNDIRDRIVELSHQTSGDGEVQTKVLGWLNAAYHELLDEVASIMPAAVQLQEEIVTGSDGVGLLASPIRKVIRVMDLTDGLVLEVTTPAAAMDALGGSGAPRLCVAAGQGLTVYPAAAVTLRVLYVPLAADLAENGAEDSILLPRNHHFALVWGGLVWSALFERGFASQAELQLYQRKWDDAKQRVKLSLAGNTGETLRVKPFSLV